MKYVRAMTLAAFATDSDRKAAMFQYAFDAKVLTFESLAGIFGVEHPRSRQVLGRLMRMVGGKEMGEEEKRSGKRKVREVLERYGWKLEVDDVVQQGEEETGESVAGEVEVGQYVAGPEWDEQWMRKRKLDFILEPLT